jgi:PAS domain S-box-containing protein
MGDGGIEANPPSLTSHMSDVASPSRSGVAGALLLVAAAAAVTVYMLLPAGRTAAIGSEIIAVTSCFVAAVVMLAPGRKRPAWPSAPYVGLTVVFIGLANLIFLILDISQHGDYQPRAIDALFLLVLVPLSGAARAEYKQHFSARDRREVAVDAMLITASLAAIAYVLIRPVGADAQVAISAASFALLAAAPVTAFGALALWVPSRAHLVQFVIFLVFSTAALMFGYMWTHGLFEGTLPFVDQVFIGGPLALAALISWGRRSSEPPPERAPVRWASPVLASISVLTACVGLGIVSLLDDPHRVSAGQSEGIIAFLGIAIAARILSNQFASSSANREVHSALDEKEDALNEADLALETVRTTIETLRQSEEHLRMVFETAVDGIVELDERGVILRANEAFCRMVGLERRALEGRLWSALAAAVDKPDGTFAGLPTTGTAQIQRREGQPLYLESRLSDIPTDPPRKLLLIRDVTAGRVADQTIRSLFQFLQDRDEDRTRLLRRTNAAIESERNRIARDLHDGPVQGVSAASLSLEAASLMIKAGEIERGLDVLAKIRQELAGEADGLRRLMSGLRPPVLEERGLVPALRETLARFGAENGVVTEFQGSLTKPLPEDLETLAYRVVQEALSNAGKHARAERVALNVETNATQLRIEIEDNGRGFDNAQAREFLKMGRVGLASMRERVELASGTFVVRSTPGRGTTIVATLPVDSLPSEREMANLDAV